MDTGFDMNTKFSAAQNRSNLWMLLKSVSMEKYVDQLIQKGVDFHTFANMTREDMRLVGIMNHQDQDAMMSITKSLSKMYEQLNPKPVRWNKVVSNLHDQTLTLAGALVSLRCNLGKMPVEHSLVDQDTPSTKAILTLLKLIDSRADLIMSDIAETMKRYDPETKQNKTTSKKIVITGALVAIVMIGGCAIILRRKMTS